MKEKNTPSKPATPIEVEVTVFVSQSTAHWLIEIADLHGDTPQSLAARILDDVAREDRLAHNEPDQMTLH